MKKWTTILLLLIANSILLVHAAVPHHLYEGVFCEINTSCKTECANPLSDKIHHHHKHQDVPHNLDCELDVQVVLPSSFSDKNIISVIELDLLIYQPISGIEKNDLLKPYLIYQRQFIPKKSNLYLLSLSSNQGLRAPPIFV